MNQWTMHERSATYKTTDESKMATLMSFVAGGWITTSQMQKQDGVFSVEVYVTPNNNFGQTLKQIRHELR